METPRAVATPEDLRTIYTLAVSGLFLTVAAFLGFARPASTARRLLAAFFGVLAFMQFAGSGLRPLNIPGSSAAWQDLRVLRTFLWLGFIALYPTPVRLRSWHGLVLLGVLAHAMLLAAFWLFARDALAQNNLAAYALNGADAGLGLAVAAGLATAFARAGALPRREQRGAFLVLAGAGLFFTTLGSSAARFALTALGEPDVRVGQVILEDPLLLGLHLAFIAVMASMVGLLAWRHRAYVPLLLAAWGALLIAMLGAVEGPASGFSAFQSAPTALVILYALARCGAFGAPAPGRLAGPVLAGAAFLTLFVMTNIFVLTFSEDPLLLALGMLAGLAAGGIGAGAVLAPELLRPGPASEDRLGPYRAALEAEVAVGTAAHESSRKLQGLRRELGITDTEHALMDYTLRSAGASAAAAPSLSTGALFAGRYRVARGLGKAGAGPAYLCKDERAGRDVVVKLLRGAGGAGDGLAAALREARALAAVKHPRVVTLYDVEAVGDQGFLVMEYAEGGSLAARLQDGPLPREAWRSLANDLLEGLEAAHGAGVVHRDVKPSNVLFSADGRAKLGDFGVAHEPGMETTMGWAGAGDGAVGTVRYMSPEQARGRPVGARSDLYSSAVVLYEAWSGQPYMAPRSGESSLELQMRVGTAQGFDRPFTGPAALRGWFHKALHPDPEQRFASAREMRAALRAAAGP